MNVSASVYSQELRSDPNSGNRASVVAVTAQVAGLLPVVSQATDPKLAFQDCMKDRWGSQLSITTLGLVYEWAWDPDQRAFVWICKDALKLDIAYATGDTVVVEFAVVQVLST